MTGSIDPVVDRRGFTRVGKGPPVKADLAIYTPVSGVSVWCSSLAFMPSYKWDFNSCAIREGFYRSSHNYDYISQMLPFDLLSVCKYVTISISI